MNLKNRIELINKPSEWLNQMAVDHHYIHRPIHQKASPFGWGVKFDGELFQPDKTPSGFIIFCSIHYIRLQNEFGYPGLPTKWQVLSLARLWLHDNLPKNSETCVIAKAIKMVQKRWIEVHPPRYLDQPYHILKIISYSNSEFHLGTIYKAANFRESGKTKSQKRFKNSRGPGLGDSTLIRFIYDLKKPKWNYEPKQLKII